MKVKGTLNFSSYELEELRAKAEADNKFDFFNPFEYLSVFITALCVIGFFSACAPTLYLQARVIRYTTYGLELVITLVFNWLITRKFFGRGGYIKCNKLWESVPFMKLIQLINRIEYLLEDEDIEHKSVLLCENRRAIILENTETGYIATSMIKFPSNSLMNKVFTEDGLDLVFLNNEVDRIVRKEAYYYIKSYAKERA